MTGETQDAPERVAIVGTGLAGLTTAYILNSDEKKRFSVTLYEQAETLAFDGASVAVKSNLTGQVERVDLPMRASAGGYYSNLNNMYDYLGIRLHPIRFLFVFAEALTGRRSITLKDGGEIDSIGDAIRSYFVHASNLHQTPPPWPKNRGPIQHLWEVLFLIVCYLWFSIACSLVPPLIKSTKGAASAGGENLEDYLRRIQIPNRFVVQYLIPLMSSVSTCSHAEMLAFPASDVVNYKNLSNRKQHYAVCGGISQVQERLSEGIEDVRLGARVVDIATRTDGKGVSLKWSSTAGGGDGKDIREETFDRVVLAVSPDVAGKIFEPLKGIADKIPTAQVESSVLMPTSKLGSQGYEVVDDESVEGVAGCMHHGSDASRAQRITFKTEFSGKSSRTEALHAMPSGVVVSTCPLDAETADAEHTLQYAKFTRTLRTPESRATVEKIMGRGEASDDKGALNGSSWVSGQDNVWLAGAWCWDGMVLLEGCVVSAMKVADDFGVEIPWRRA